MNQSRYLRALMCGGTIAVLSACNADEPDPVNLPPDQLGGVTAPDAALTPPPALTPTPGNHEPLPDANTNPAPFAIADLAPTEGNEAMGEISFTQSDDGLGVLVKARIVRLPPGPHGFHIHERGDCSAPDASSAGDHYNPTNMPHGARTAQQRHVGDLGNVIADADGEAMLDVVDRVLWEQGAESILGRAVVIHAGEDDLDSQPSGDAGDPLACGVIRSTAG